MLTPDLKNDLLTYLEGNAQSPEDYIIGKFAGHDAVLLAESHGIKHFVELFSNLIPRLYAAGVRNAGMEFGAEEDQEALDRLVVADEYDESLARRLMFNYNVGWAYREYMDVYRKAWDFNRNLPAGAPPFRVLNLSYRYDWSRFKDRRTPYIMQQVFHRGDTERFRADIVQREVFEQGEKILILTGAVHAFTKYRYPELDSYAPGFVRLRDVMLGNHLEVRAPGRNATIMLHIPWDAIDAARQMRPLSGIIDEVMDTFGNKRVGFDTEGSPFESFVDETSYYATGYPGFTLATLADGYIYERPFRLYEGCTVDEAFLTDANWSQAREQVPDPDWRGGRPATREEYMHGIRAFVDMPRRLAAVS